MSENDSNVIQDGKLGVVRCTASCEGRKPECEKIDIFGDHPICGRWMHHQYSYLETQLKDSLLYRVVGSQRDAYKRLERQDIWDNLMLAGLWLMLVVATVGMVAIPAYLFYAGYLR